MTICEICKREFDLITTTCGVPYTHGDGRIYSDCTWSGNHISPYCGCDNGIVIRMGSD
jgi:hypothetical protein